MITLPEIIDRKLGALRARLKTTAFIEGCAILILVLFAMIVFTFLFDYTTPLPWGMRAFLDLVALVLLTFAARRWLLRPLARRLDQDSLAIMVEEEYAGGEKAFYDSLISTVQFSRDRQLEFEFNSPVLVAKVVLGTATKSRGVDFNRAVKPGKAYRFALWALLGIVAIGLYAKTYPENAGMWFSRQVLLSDREWPKVNELVLINKIEDLTVAHGEMLEILFRSVGKRPPRHVTLTAWFVDDLGNPVGGKKRVDTFDMEAHGTEIFSRTFDPVGASFKFFVEGGDFSSEDKPYMVRVLTRPHIESIVCDIEYPPYVTESGFPPPRKHYTGNLREPEGALVRFKAYTSKPVKFAKLMGIAPIGDAPATFEGGRIGRIGSIPVSEKEEPKPVTHDFPEGTGNVIEGAFRIPPKATRYRFFLRDVQDFESKPAYFQLTPIPDTPPRVAIKMPGKNIESTPVAEVTLKVDVTDDYGVESLRCFWLRRRETASGIEETKPVLLDWGNVSGLGGKKVNHRFVWDLSTIGLKVGDTIFYHMEAGDAKEIGGPGLGKSDEFKIRIVSPDELKHTYAQVIDRIRDNLRRTKEFQRKTRDSLSDLASEIVSEKKYDREMKAQTSLIRADQQERIGRPISRLAEDFARVMQTMKDNKIISPDTFAEFANIQRMLEDLAKETIPSVTRELERAKEKSYKEDPVENIERAIEAQEQVIDSLQGIVDRLTDWSDINDIIREVERLKRMQEGSWESLKKLLQGEPK
ncbi:MAG: hypothetical protein E3J72_05880 [Planctomycetota bacterium]|nr:MAG: hypothetical protein E3J72_05880 [Planctomycetota bacterium]